VSANGWRRIDPLATWTILKISSAETDEYVKIVYANYAIKIANLCRHRRTLSNFAMVWL
jgi:hypothetical protein